MAMDDGCGWTSREMNAGALACQNLDPLTTGMISCYFSSSGGCHNRLWDEREGKREHLS